MGDFNNFVPPQFHNRRMKTVYSDSDLNNYILQTIMEWSKNDYTSTEHLYAYLYQMIQPPQMRDKIVLCNSWKNHRAMIQDIDSQIRSMLTLRAAVTFFDVVNTIRHLYPEHHSHVGPLTKIPLVKEVLFSNSIPRDKTPELRLTNLIEDCGEFLNQRIENSRRPNDEVTILALTEEQFLFFLKHKYQTSSIRALGLKITNFAALRNAVHIHKIDSYSKQFKSKKLTQLLRTEVTEAMGHIVTKLKSTKIFPKDSRVKEEIEKFATLPFKEAIQKFFQPFFDEEERIFEDHEIDGRMVTEDPLAAVKSLCGVLSQEKVYGKLFHLAAVIGAVHETRGKEEIKLVKNHEASVDLKSFTPKKWRNKVFYPLLCDISEFLQLYLSRVDDIDSVNISEKKVSEVEEKIVVVNPFLKKVANAIEKPKQVDKVPLKVNKREDMHPCVEKLDAIMCRIVERCTRLIDIIENNTKVKIFKDKVDSLASLLLCCESITKLYKNRDSLLDIECMARLHLDLLPQAHTLLVSVMSKCKLEQENSKKMAMSKAVVDIVYKSVFSTHFSERTENGITLDKVIELESEILKIMELPEWPLEGSFLEYVVSTGLPEVQDSAEQERHEEGPCHCLAISPQFLDSKLQRLIKQRVTIETLIEQVLPSQYGLIISDSIRKQVSQLWTNACQNMSSVAEDGAPAVVDVQSSNLASHAIRQTRVMVTVDSEEVMRTIFEVELLGDVPNVTKWNELYRHYWGDVSQFVQDNVPLASKYNIRIVETQLGTLRVNITTSDSDIKEAANGLGTDDTRLFEHYCRRIVGYAVSLLLKSPSSLCDIVNCVTDSLSTSTNIPQRFSSFLSSTLSIVSSEFISDMFTQLLQPISRCLFNLSSVSELQKALSSCSSSTLTLLCQCLDNEPALTPLTQSPLNNVSIMKKRTTVMSVDLKYEEQVEGEQREEEEERNMEEEVVINDNNYKSREEKYQIVEDIRRNQFGIGLKCDSDTDLVISNCNRRMARLVDHFSSDLYANPTHFVLELIQNADDNLYDNNTRPELTLSWQTAATTNDTTVTLQVVNNERGFTDSDLQSLCDIGTSTKSTKRLEKIGRKGIGFKSVFLVSDCPEVHSNGFHIRFNRFSKDDISNDSNGLVPFWIDSASTLCYHNDRTTIVLPIVARLRHSLRDSVSRQLQPSLLLFLRKLKRISIVNDSEEQSIELIDEECRDNRKVILDSGGMKHVWFLCSRQVAIVDPRLAEISPRGLQSTDISVAVPFNDSDVMISSRDMPAFAFLPIRSYGLRFIVNCDFTIPASREDITNNCPWNKWLIDQVAEVFVHTVNRYLAELNKAEPPSSHFGICRLVDSVPLPGEVPGDSPFVILIPKLRHKLSQLCWLPDLNNRFYSPSQLIIESNEDSQLTETLCSRLGMSFLHRSISVDADDRRMSVLKWLGCQQLSLSHLASLLALIGPQELSDTSLVKSIIIAVYHGLQKEGTSGTANRVLSLLRSLPLWPILTDNQDSLHISTINIDNCPVPVFVPPSHWTVNSPITDQYYLLRRVVSPSFIAQFYSDVNRHTNPAVLLLKRLGAHELSNTAMLEHVISPALSHSSTPKSRQWFIKVSQFLLEHCSPANYRDTIIPQLSFATVTYTAKGQMFPTVTQHSDIFRVHLPLTLDNTLATNVVSVLHNRVSYTVIDDEYLHGSSQCATQWSKFFLTAGVSKTFYQNTDNTEDNSILLYPELGTLLQLNDVTVNIELLRYLDLNWSLLNSSSLSDSLALLNWIPVSTKSHSDFFTADSQLSCSGTTLYRPSQVVYISSNDPNKLMISDSLLPHFPFCPLVFHNELLPRQLGMVSQVTPQHILALFKIVLVEQSVKLNREQVYDLYTWINRHLSKTSLRDMFNQLKTMLNGELLLLVPTENSSVVELMATGHCYWSLPFNLVYLQSQQVHEDLVQMLSEPHINSSQKPLVNLFPELRELFVEIIEIQEFPHVESISHTLHSTLGLLTPDRLKDLNIAEIDLITDVFNIIHCLDNYHKQTCRHQIKEMRLIPCLSGRYRAFNEITKDFKIYSWRNMSNVESFQNVIGNALSSPVADFVSINLFTRRENFHQQNEQKKNQRRLSASQFLTHYFDLPLLEDNICSFVENRDEFEYSVDIKSMFAHLEVILAQWMQINMAHGSVSQSLHLLASITHFYLGPSRVRVTSSLLEHQDTKFTEEKKVYIGCIGGTDSFEMLIGGLELDSDGVEIFDSLMNSLTVWLLDGDSMSHLRHRFKKFYKSLLDLIESSDRNQVSIFIRSHNLRIHPFSIDYIYNMFARHSSSPPSQSASPAPVLLATDNTLTADSDNEEGDEEGESLIEEGSRKRSAVSVAVEVVQLAKQPRLDSDSGDSGTVALSSGKARLSSVTDSCSAQPSSSSSIYQSGRLGEQLANNKLSLCRRLGDMEIIKMDWVNEVEETRLPYDFKLIVRNSSSSSESTETIYLEVKATTKKDKTQFDLSPQEVTAAWSFKTQYHLLLVFLNSNSNSSSSSSSTGEPGDKVQYAHIPNLLGQLQDNHCKLLLDLSSMLTD